MSNEQIARVWHEGSDHQLDGTPFGGGVCNCEKVAKRLSAIMAKAWEEGRQAGLMRAAQGTDNPYRETL